MTSARLGVVWQTEKTGCCLMVATLPYGYSALG